MNGEGESVRASRLADWLGVSQPTVGAAVQRLVRDGLLDVSASKVISLTDLGQREAARVVRRHRIVERWLTDVLGFNWLQADEEAGKLEHALSDEVADRLFVQIGKPATCPHGNPIPGVKAPARNDRRLDSLDAGQRARISRISEVAEHDAPELLTFLDQSGLLLGVEVEVRSVNPGARTLTLGIADQEVTMSLDVAGKVSVATS